MKRRIYTSDEDIFKAIQLFLISIVIMAIGTIIIPLFHYSKSKYSLIIVGSVVLVLAILQFVLALEKNKFHKECMKKNTPIKGEIIKIVEASNGTGYFLHIRFWNPETGKDETIISDSYRIYVLDYLASPHVQVYVDKISGKYVIDGFVLKKDKSEPNIVL